MFNPKTLATLATFMLPPRQNVPPNIFQDFTGGGYFYLDNHDRVVTSTTTHHILVIAETAGAPGFRLMHDYDLSHVLTASEKITSALPDSRAAAYALFVWPRISVSPTTIESSPDVTRKRCCTHSSPS